MYYVHYLGWNTRYDEWVERQRVAQNLTWSQTRAKKGRSASREAEKKEEKKEKELPVRHCCVLHSFRVQICQKYCRFKVMFSSYALKSTCTEIMQKLKIMRLQISFYLLFFRLLQHHDQFNPRLQREVDHSYLGEEKVIGVILHLQQEHQPEVKGEINLIVILLAHLQTDYLVSVEEAEETFYHPLLEVFLFRIQINFSM